MITLLRKDNLKNWIASLVQSTGKEKIFIGVSRRKYKDFHEIEKAAEEYYDGDAELMVRIIQFTHMKKGKIGAMIKKYGSENMILDDLTIQHEDELNLDESYHFYKIVVAV